MKKKTWKVWQTFQVVGAIGNRTGRDRAALCPWPSACLKTTKDTKDDFQALCGDGSELINTFCISKARGEGGLERGFPLPSPAAEGERERGGGRGWGEDLAEF